MKRSMKFLSLLLALVMLLSVMPMAALAEEGGGAPASIPATPLEPAIPTYTSVVNVVAYCVDKDISLGSYTVTIHRPTTFGAHNFGTYLNYGGQIYECCGGGGVVDPRDNKPHTVVVYYTRHYHNYVKGHDRYHHWEACRCGSTLSYAPHVDPLEAKDSICTCGYKFSDNANLTYLWMNDMNNQPFFNKDITEYQCTVYDYHKSGNVAYSYQTFDSKATVTEPKDKTLREGMNVYEFTVTAEDKKTTKTYTVYASKPSTLDYITVYSTGNLKDGFTTKLEPHVIPLNNTASVTLPELLGERISFQAKNAKSSQVIIEPVCSRWGIDILYFNIPAKIWTELSYTDADLVIKTYFGNINVPNAEFEKLAKEGDSLKLALSKEEGNAVLTITAGDKEVKNGNITLTAPEK